MKKIIAFIVSIILFFVGLFSGCSNIADTKWELTAWSVSSADLDDYSMTLAFEETTFSGRSAVNSYGGEYITLPGGRITFIGMYWTEMAGSPEAMQAESTYFALLGSVKKYRASDDVLTLFDENNNEVLIFEKAP